MLKVKIYKVVAKIKTFVTISKTHGKAKISIPKAEISKTLAGMTKAVVIISKK